MLVGEIEGKVSAYIQNMKISETIKSNLLTQVNMKKDMHALETLEGENGNSPR
jgi:hypothetical protein